MLCNSLLICAGLGRRYDRNLQRCQERRHGGLLCIRARLCQLRLWAHWGLCPGYYTNFIIIFFPFFFLLNQNSGLWWHKFSGCLKTIRHIDVSLQKSNTSIFTKKEIYTSCTELSIYLNQVGPCHHLTAHILEAEFWQNGLQTDF